MHIFEETRTIEHNQITLADWSISATADYRINIKAFLPRIRRVLIFSAFTCDVTAADSKYSGASTATHRSCASNYWNNLKKYIFIKIWRESESQKWLIRVVGGVSRTIVPPLTNTWNQGSMTREGEERAVSYRSIAGTCRCNRAGACSPTNARLECDPAWGHGYVLSEGQRPPRP